MSYSATSKRRGHNLVGQLPDLHTLWVGPRLSWLERLCIASWLAHGHRVTLWAYRPVAGVPRGVELRDAEEILPQRAITLHRETGSVTLFADRFRYHLLRRHSVTWLDTDALLLRPLKNVSPYLFGWQTPDMIAIGVLRIPPDSPLLGDLISLIDARVPVPPFFSLKEKIRQRSLGLVGRQQRAEDMPWATFGPHAFTAFIRRRGLAGYALPLEVFYPIIWNDYELYFGPPAAVEARLSDAVISVHLWGSSHTRDRCNEPPPPGSWLERMCKSYDVASDDAEAVSGRDLWYLESSAATGSRGEPPSEGAL